MRYGNKFLSILLLFAVAILATVSVSSRQDIKLADEDKAQIVEAILSNEKLQNRELRASEEKGIIYLSTDNLPSDLELKIPKIKVVLLKPDEIKEREKTGLRHFAFGDFRVDGAKVEVLLNDTWQNVSTGSVAYRALTYKCHKVSGKWLVEPIKFP